MKYILYGAGTQGKVVYRKAIKCGLEICAFIDKRYAEIEEIDGLSVHPIEWLSDEYNRNDVCIIVTVKDVFEHEKIKNQLMGIGMKLILYKPLAVLDGKGNDIEKRIDSLYDLLINETYDINAEIPPAPAADKNQINLIINSNNDAITAYVPINLIYTNYDAKKEKTWGNIPIMALLPHVELFRYFGGCTDCSFERYLNFCIDNAKREKIETTDAWKQNVLRNRRNVYDQMSYYWTLDRDFFIRNAPEVRWNEEMKYFNLTGGKHRAAYMVARGEKLIPCRMNTKDYQKFVQENIVDIRDSQCLEDLFVLSTILNKLAKDSLESEGYISFTNSINIIGDFSDFVIENLYKTGVLVKTTDEEYCFEIRRNDNSENLNELIASAIFGNVFVTVLGKRKR